MPSFIDTEMKTIDRDAIEIRENQNKLSNEKYYVTIKSNSHITDMSGVYRYEFTKEQANIIKDRIIQNQEKARLWNLLQQTKTDDIIELQLRYNELCDSMLKLSKEIIPKRTRILKIWAEQSAKKQITKIIDKLNLKNTLKVNDSA